MTPRQVLRDEKAATIARGYSQCNTFIRDFAKAGPQGRCLLPRTHSSPACCLLWPHAVHSALTFTSAAWLVPPLKHSTCVVHTGPWRLWAMQHWKPRGGVGEAAGRESGGAVQLPRASEHL